MFKPSAVALLFTLAAAPASADRLPGERYLSDTVWGYQIVTAPTRAGAEAQWFEVRPGDCAANADRDDCDRDRERSEFRPDLDWPPGTPMWIGFSVFLPQDFPVSTDVKTTIAQIHQRGGPIQVAGGMTSRPPVMQLELFGADLQLTIPVPGESNLHVDLAEVTALRGVWTDFRVFFEGGPDPVLRVWINGDLRADVSAWPSQPPDAYFFRYGVYRSFVSRHDGPMPTQILLIDEVRLGPTPGDVALNLANPVD